MAHQNHRAHRLQQPLLPVPVAPDHHVHLLLRPAGRPVRHHDRPFLPRRVQRLPLVLPQPHRGRQAQNRGLLARIGHAHGIVPTLPSAVARHIFAGVRAVGPQPHRLPPCQPGCRISVQLLPPIPPHVRAARVQPGADPRCPHEHRVQPGLPLAVVAAPGVLEQLASTSIPVPSTHTGTYPHRCPHACAPSGTSRRLTSRAHSRNPSRAAACSRCRSVPSRRLAGPARSPHVCRATSSAPGRRPRGGAPRRRRPSRSAPAASAQRCNRAGGAGGGPRRPASRAARGTGPAAPPRRARPGPSSRRRRRRKPGGSAVGGQGASQKTRCIPGVQSANTPRTV